MQKLFIIDTFNLLHRAYHALPKTFTDVEGNPTNAVYGVTSMVVNILEVYKPEYLAAAIDGEEVTFRAESFNAYKAHRKPMDSDLSVQIPKVFEVLDAFDITQIKVTGYEADDIIGTLSEKFKDKFEVIIVSNDRDMWQLLDENVSVLIPDGRGSNKFIRYTDVKDILGVQPVQIPDYKGLRGDPSDNIPGVYGVGEKSAQKLINEYGSIEEIYSKISQVQPDSLRNKLANCAEEAVMSKQLATIITDVPMQVTIDELKYRNFVATEVVKILSRYRFKSLLKRLGLSPVETPTLPADSDQLSLF